MKILLIGNHTCGNRGDGAILRGLITRIEQTTPQAELTITSRYPVSSTYLLGRPVIADPMAPWHKGWRSSFPRKFQNRFRNRYVPKMLAKSVAAGDGKLPRFLPDRIRSVIASMRDYDLAIQVGRSFFVDLYGARQFELPFAALLAGRPVVLLGHSMGPFGGREYSSMAATLLRTANGVALREDVSRDLIRKAGLPEEKVCLGADTAWLVDPNASVLGVPDLSALTQGRQAVAITTRELAPFDRRLGVTQQQFEGAYARLADHIIEKGFDVVACSTCTGIDSYHRDDRMSALRVQSRVANPARFHVIMDELNDVQLGKLLGSCALLVGTRLHSAIIAMNFGTPAFAVNYEHKSEGIFAQLGLPELATSVAALIDGSLITRVETQLLALNSLRIRVAEAVEHERQRARSMVDETLARYRPV